MTYIENSICGGPWDEIWKLVKLWYNSGDEGDEGAEPEGDKDPASGNESNWTDDALDAIGDVVDVVTDFLETPTGKLVKGAGGNLKAGQSAAGAIANAVEKGAIESEPVSDVMSGLSIDFTEGVQELAPWVDKATLGGTLAQDADGKLEVGAQFRVSKEIGVKKWDFEGFGCFGLITDTYVDVRLGFSDWDPAFGGGFGGRVNWSNIPGTGGTWAKDVSLEAGADFDIFTGETTWVAGVNVPH